MNADGLIDRILVETTGEREAAVRLMTEMLLALFCDMYERQDFYTVIAAQNPPTAEIWALLRPDLERAIAELRAIGYQHRPVDDDDPFASILAQYPEAFVPLLEHYPCPLTPDEADAVERILWGDSDAHD